MASSGSFSTNESYNRGLTFSWWVNSQSTSGNYTDIGWNLVGSGSNSSYVMSGPFNVWVSGAHLYDGSNDRIQLRNGTVVASGTHRLYHDSNGNCSFTAYAEGAIYAYAINCWGEQTWSLPQIPRYANITSFSVSNRSGIDGLTSVKYSYSTDANCDWAWYSVNGGAWTNLPNSNIISGLEDGKSYNFRLKVRRTDSQLTTESGTVTRSTYSRNKISTIYYPNNGNTALNGNELRITATSPSGAKNNIRLKLQNTDHEILKENTLDTTFTVEEMNSFLQYISGASSGNLVAISETLDGSGNVKYTHETTINYSIIDSDPLFYDFTYLDINQVTKNLTGNNKYCVLNYSYMKVIIPVDNKAVAQNYATMNKYRYSITQDQTIDREYNDILPVEMVITDNQLETGNPVGAKSGTLTVNAIDSRGNSTPVQKECERIITYENLIKTDTGNAQRVDESGSTTGVEERVNVSFNGKMWNGNFGVVQNSIKLATYRYKKLTSLETEWTAGVTPINVEVNENGEFSFSGNLLGDTDLGFDIGYAYVIEVTVSDELSTVIYSINISSGTPHVAYAENGVGIMGKYDENEGGPFQVEGKNIMNLIAMSGGGDSEPIGSAKLYFGQNEPDGYKFADGQALDRAEYSELFDVYGVTYGSGNGSTTFNVPDLRGKVPVGLHVNKSWFNNLGKTGGEEQVTLTIETMPSHEHGIWFPPNTADTRINSDSIAGSASLTIGGLGGSTYALPYATATGGGQAHNNLQPYIITNYIIKAKNTSSANVLVPDYIPIGAEFDYYGSEIPDGYEQVSYDERDITDVYSLQETMIGKWIDNKPLYRKVLHYDSISFTRGTNNEIEHKIENIKIITNIRYSLLFENDQNNYTDWDIIINTRGNNEKITFTLTGSGTTNFGSSDIIIEYTKTTD